MKQFLASACAALALVLFVIAQSLSALAGPKVVVSIKPVHSLVSAIMNGVDEPALIMEGAQSPHTFSLQPSSAKSLQNADLVFWVGPLLETALTKPLTSIASKATKVGLMKSSGIQQLPFGEEGHSHEHDGHEHDEHGHDDDKKESDEHHPKHAGNFDPHIWLDPENGKAMAVAIAKTLIEADGQNREIYERNLAELTAKLDTLSANISEKLQTYRNSRFVVFHAAYGHFEKRFGLKAPVVIGHNPEVAPGARRLREIQAEIARRKVKCVFSEPQFNPAFMRALESDSSVQMGVLDPLGQAFDAGPDHYFQTLNALADSLVECFSR